MSKSDYEKINISSDYSASSKEDIINRRSVNKIKKMIILVIVFLILVPIILCIYLIGKVNRLNDKIETLSTIVSQRSIEEEVVVEDISADLLELDRQASDDLSVNTTEENAQLMTSNDESEKDTNYVNVDKRVYLTFDDGPSANTEEILSILAANDVKATFFVVHKDDESLWPLYNAIVDQGHTLAMHSYSHVYSSVYGSYDSFVDDLTQIHDFLMEQTGVDCRYYRFPGGSSNTVSSVDMQSLIGYLTEEDITYFDWNALNGDAVQTYQDSTTLNANVMNYVRKNEGPSVVLMHDLDTCGETVEGLQNLIDTLKSEGYILCAIDDSTPLVQHVKHDDSSEEDK